MLKIDSVIFGIIFVIASIAMITVIDGLIPKLFYACWAIGVIICAVYFAYHESKDKVSCSKQCGKSGVCVPEEDKCLLTIIRRTCAVCGNEFDVTLNSDRKIVSDCFYGGKIRFGVGNWSLSKAKQDERGNLVLDNDGLMIWEKCHPWWRELKYRLTDLKRLILHQYKDVEYFECSKCLHKHDGDKEDGEQED